jgi:uncharacterized protein YutE (UPF0331/DUF86 family)
MSNLAVIENKISLAQKYLKILERYEKFSREEIENNLDVRGATERYLYLAAQATIDLAEAIIAFRKFRKPMALTESFHILNEESVISSEVMEKMVKMVGFRNVISHDYAKLNYDIVYEVLHKRLIDIENFIQQILNFLERC